MSTLSFAEGAIIGGRYRLESPLGQGGMGAVWRAQHTTLKSPVAVKFINPNLANSESVISRFLLEAQSAAALRSTHIVQVFDFGVEDGVPYIAMELLPGESLAERLERETRLGFEETIHIMFDVARAVAHAHDAGIVHRDLKPENIFLVEEKGVQLAKVLDFGVAKVTGGSLDLSTGGGTRTGAILGTPFYVSPEQGRGNQTIDHRSDLWALGIITYECVVGSLPFDSEGLGDLIMKICAEPHPPASSKLEVPDGFDAWVDKALAKDPDDRFQGALSMFEELSQIVLGSANGGRLSGHVGRSSTGDRKWQSGATEPGEAREAVSRTPTTTGATASDLEPSDKPPMKSSSTYLLSGAAVLGLIVAGALFTTREQPASTLSGDEQPAESPVEATATQPESEEPSGVLQQRDTAPAKGLAEDPDSSDGRMPSPPAAAHRTATPSPPMTKAPPVAPQVQARTRTHAPAEPASASQPAVPAPSPPKSEERDPFALPPPRTAPAKSVESASAPTPKPDPPPKPKSREELARELMRSYD